MTYQKAQEEIKRKTAKLIDKNAAIMIAEYETAYKEILKELDNVFAKYLRTKDPQDYYNIMLRYGRLDNLLTQIQREYVKVSNRVGGLIKKSSVLAMTNTYNLESYLSKWIVPDYKFQSLDPDLIELSITGTQESWKKIKKSIRNRYNLNRVAPQYGTLSDLLFKNRRVELTNINSAITQTFLQGKTYNQLRMDIRDQFDTSKFNAMRIAQTEGNRVANAGAYANMKELQVQGNDAKKFWIATLDTETRDRHRSLDVKYSAENAIDIDDYFKIDGHEALHPLGFGVASLDVGCRCTTGTKIGDLNPAQLRRGRNPVTGKNEVFNYKDYDEYAKKYGIAA